MPAYVLPQGYPEQLEVAGDLLQSSASRLAEWALRQAGLPYEVHMAALEAKTAVNDWTDARRPRR